MLRTVVVDDEGLARDRLIHLLQPYDEVEIVGEAEDGEDAITREHHYWVQPTLNELEKRVDPRAFFRISRGVMVNLSEVKEVAPSVGGYGEVVLSRGTRLEVSRRRFKDLLGKLDSGGSG
jgi:DNA-binding LytR/AlgR family response regulator